MAGLLSECSARAFMTCLNRLLQAPFAPAAPTQTHPDGQPYVSSPRLRTTYLISHFVGALSPLKLLVEALEPILEEPILEVILAAARDYPVAPVEMELPSD